MKNNIKAIVAVVMAAFAIFAIVAVVVPQKSEAQNSFFNPATVFSTATLTGKALTNDIGLTNTLDIGAWKEISVQYIGACPVANHSSNTTVTLRVSNDRSTWVAGGVLVTAQSGTTVVSGITNATLNGHRYLKLELTTAAIAGGGVTNGSVIVNGK